MRAPAVIVPKSQPRGHRGTSRDSKSLHASATVDVTIGLRTQILFSLQSVCEWFQEKRGKRKIGSFTGKCKDF